MKDQLISFETAKLAKEKGFNIPTHSNYNVSGTCETTVNLINWNGRNSSKFPDKFSTPTQSLLQKWLREEHKISLWVEPNIHDEHFTIHSTKIDFNFVMKYRTYEEALEDGLMKALKLIP